MSGARDCDVLGLLGMAGTILSDVAYGYEMNPSDFSQVGYVAIIDDKGQRHRGLDLTSRDRRSPLLGK